MSDTTQSIFERMLPMESRELFLRERAVRYEREVDEYLSLCSYLISDRCTGDIQRLVDGDYTWPLARMSLLRKFGTTKRRAVFVYPDDQRHLLMYLSWHMHCFDDSFGLLGFQLRGEELDVADFTLYKARRKMRIRAKKLNRLARHGKATREEATRYMINYTNRFFCGGGSSELLNWTEWFFGIITRPDSLVQLDEYVQTLIRYVATGKLGRSRYRFTHEQLKEMGYRSLVSSYWRNRHEDVKQWRSVRLSELREGHQLSA